MWCVQAKGTSSPSICMRKVECWGPIIAEILFDLAAAWPIPRWIQLRGNGSWRSLTCVPRASA